MGGLHGVFGVHGGAGAVHIGDDHGHVLLPLRVGLDAHMDAAGPEALGGADAALNKIQHRDPPFSDQRFIMVPPGAG